MVRGNAILLLPVVSASAVPFVLFKTIQGNFCKDKYSHRTRLFATMEARALKVLFITFNYVLDGGSDGGASSKKIFVSLALLNRAESQEQSVSHTRVPFYQ